MENFGLVSEKDAIISLIVKTNNEMRVNEVFNRVYLRKDFKNDLNEQMKLMMGANQEKIKLAKETIADLLDMLKDASDDKPLAKTIKDILE